MKKNVILCILPLIVLCLSLPLHFIGYRLLTFIYDKYNDLRLNPLLLSGLDDNNKYNNSYDIVILGDSLGAGWKFSGNYSTLNLGIGGQTTSQVKYRSDLIEGKIKGDILIIIAGGNDIKCIPTNYHRKDQILDQAAYNIKEIVRNHQNDFNSIVLVTIPPMFRIPFYLKHLKRTKIFSASIIELNDKIRNLAAEMDVELLDAFTILSEKKNDENLTTDGAHLNKRAYQYLEKEIISFF